jgi:hypothetical protein
VAPQTLVFVGKSRRSSKVKTCRRDTLIESTFEDRGGGCDEGSISLPRIACGRSNEPPVWRQLVFPVVLPQEEMLPENFVCFGPKFDVDRDEIVSSVSTFLQDTYRGW